MKRRKNALYKQEGIPSAKQNDLVHCKLTITATQSEQLHQYRFFVTKSGFSGYFEGTEDALS